MTVFARTSRSFNKAMKTFTTCRVKVRVTSPDSICERSPAGYHRNHSQTSSTAEPHASDSLVATCTFPSIAQTFKQLGAQSHSKAIKKHHNIYIGMIPRR